MPKIKTTGPKKDRPIFLNLFADELDYKFREFGEIYRRKIKLIRGAEQITKATVVETRLPNGTLETTQQAKPGDWIVVGSRGERFVFTDEKFHGLYESDGKEGWLPRERKIIVIRNPTGQNVRISAPWGTAEKPMYQEGGAGAMLVAEISSDGEMTEDRYIIGDEELLLNNYDPDTPGQNASI